MVPGLTERASHPTELQRASWLATAAGESARRLVNPPHLYRFADVPPRLLGSPSTFDRIHAAAGAFVPRLLSRIGSHLAGTTVAIGPSRTVARSLSVPTFQNQRNGTAEVTLVPQPRGSIKAR